MTQTILIVEDEPAIADNIVYALETEGFQVHWRATTVEAQGVLDAQSVHLVVLDVGLPDRSGFDWCRDLRKHSNVPVIFLTARSDEIDRVVGLELGGDDYMAKPFSPRELTARVKAVLRRAAGPSTAAEECAASPIQIDAPRMKVIYFGNALDLSRYEFRMLELLAKRPGRVYTREQLMHLVWEAPEASMERTVDTHIKTLRAKMRVAHPEIDPIVTHRGVGYSLREVW
ncbi:MAG: two-component system response regulator CreB [Candidatus Hydrogenedentes bacterium]|nr:two-component system response regulator CreB [Candidatus Hydrogenedentota bacterium]